MTDVQETVVLHLFADYGTEAEALSTYGAVHRYTLNPHPNPYDTECVEMDLVENTPDVDADLVVAHPPCTRWSDMPDANKNGDAPNLIPRARELGRELGEEYIIENKPAAPLRDPVVLDGRMFGLPIKYERAFETSFKVPQPPRNARLTAAPDTSPFYYSERTHEWWKGVKGLRGDYPKEHVAKNALPMAYVDFLGRAWLEATGRAQGVADYQNYDAEMEQKRREEANQSIGGFL